MAYMGNINGMISMQSAYLPPEIITEILLHLPVIILIKFKRVSKFFLYIISNPQFIKTHLKLSKEDPSLAHFRFIFSSVLPDFDLRSCSLQTALSSKPDIAVSLHYPLKDPVKAVGIVGSVNGLVCINIEEDNLFIWNPSTRASKRLPDTGLELPNGSFKKYGFGFDDRMDDYKVVGIFATLTDEMMYNDTVTMIYSLQTNSWKNLVGFPIGLPVDAPCSYANGSLHWAVTECVLSKWKCFIISLDLSTETYGEIEQPDYEAIDPIDLILGVLGECICVIYNFKGLTEFWIMKEYGVKSSWEKRYMIPCVGDTCTCWFSIPYWMTSSGEMLMEFEEVLVLYNSNDGTCRSPEISNFLGYLEATTYVESLVSPNFDNHVVGEER